MTSERVGMGIFLSPSYLLIVYYMLILFYLILVGMGASMIPGEMGYLGRGILFVSLSTWAAITGMIGPDVAQ